MECYQGDSFTPTRSTTYGICSMMRSKPNPHGITRCCRVRSGSLVLSSSGYRMLNSEVQTLDVKVFWNIAHQVSLKFGVERNLKPTGLRNRSNVPALFQVMFLRWSREAICVILSHLISRPAETRQLFSPLKDPSVIQLAYRLSLICKNEPGMSSSLLFIPRHFSLLTRCVDSFERHPVSILSSSR